MDVVEIAQLVHRTGELDLDALDVPRARSALTDVGMVSRWADQLRIRILGRLDVLVDETPTILPEAINTATSLRSGREADRDTQRAATVAASSPIAEVFRAGDVSVDHLDVLAQAARRLEPEQRGRLLGDDSLGRMAVGSTPEQFERDLRRRVRELHTNDGIARFEQQRRAVTFRSWTERDSGMIRFTGALDPETGIRFLNRIRAKTEALFHDTLADTCPTDPLVKHEHLQGLALAALTEPDGGGTRAVTELVVTIDAKTLNSGMHPDTRVSTGHLAIELPLATIRRQACIADIIPILCTNGIPLKVGRTQRLATKSQRHALRVMYDTCAVPECEVRFDLCEPHHIVHWHPNGHTDLDNLLPLCSRHHHAVHEGGWHLDLHPTTRHLTITLPDSTQLHNDIHRDITSDISGHAPPLSRTG